MPIIREPIAKSLEGRGYETISIGGGEEALAAVRGQRPDLILLDMMMPRVDGLAVLRTLKSDPRHATIPVIMLTASADKEGILEAARLGVRDYVLKSQFNLTTHVERIEARLADGAAATNPGAKVRPSLAESKRDGPAVPAPQRASRPTGIGSANHEESVRQLKDTAPILTAAQMMDRLARCGDLKALSLTVSRLMEIVNSSTCSTDRIAKIIQQDQAVAVKILKLANSVVFYRGEPVDSVHSAVQRIGTNQIKQVVMNLTHNSHHFRPQTPTRCDGFRA